MVAVVVRPLVPGAAVPVGTAVGAATAAVGAAGFGAIVRSTPRLVAAVFGAGAALSLGATFPVVAASASA